MDSGDDINWLLFYLFICPDWLLTHKLVGCKVQCIIIMPFIITSRCSWVWYIYICSYVEATETKASSNVNIQYTVASTPSSSVMVSMSNSQQCLRIGSWWRIMFIAALVNPTGWSECPHSRRYLDDVSLWACYSCGEVV